MTLYLRLAGLLAVVLPVLLPHQGIPKDTTSSNCLYPSEHERFGVTSATDISLYDLTLLGPGAYLNWWVNSNPPHPNNIDYLPMVRVSEEGYRPEASRLELAIANNPGTILLVGNEPDTVWMGNVRPERYAQIYHEVYTTVKAVDPTVQVAIGGLSTVSTLRLEWLERVWQSYYEQYGIEMPVDVWNVHTYMVNEIPREWGPQMPPGIENAVAYDLGPWTETADPEASGGTVHASDQSGARAYFAFVGDAVTLFLRSGPDGGSTNIYIDKESVETVDLYAPVPGTVVRHYAGLTASPDPKLGRSHHVRVDVAWAHNPDSDGAWVRVDAIAAESTATLPAGRLEDNSPLRARAMSNIDDYDNIELLAEQVRTFRQWMADHGQRNKPLINTELGVLLDRDQGFDYQRVSRFMNGAVTTFLNLRDADLGYPADENRMMQQWFWFLLSQDPSADKYTNTLLYEPGTRSILPLGRDYASLIPPATDYIDLVAASMVLTPTWPIFAAQPARFEVEATVRNRGNLDSGPFHVELSGDHGTIHEWRIDGLSRRFGENSSVALTKTWYPRVTEDTITRLRADSRHVIDEPCDPNNQIDVTLEALPFTDLALHDLKVTPPPPLTRGQNTPVAVEVTLSNLGSLGTAAGQVTVSLWLGEPASGGLLLDSVRLQPETTSLPARIALQWSNARPGSYHLVATVDPASEETNLENNRLDTDFTVPISMFLPALLKGRS